MFMGQGSPSIPNTIGGAFMRTVTVCVALLALVSSLRAQVETKTVEYRAGDVVLGVHGRGTLST